MRGIRAIKKSNLKQYIGQYIHVRQRDGSIVKGKLVAVNNGRAYIKPIRNSKGKPVTSNWIIGLFLVGIVFVGIAAFWGAAWGSGNGWRGGGCYKRCCGAPCHRSCGCRHGRHRHHHGRRRRRAIYV